MMAQSLRPAMMTHEQRFDRLERIAKLFVKAGLRARANVRRLDEKIGILIDAQIKGEDRMAELKEQMKEMVQAQRRNDERFAKNDERFAKMDERFAKSDARFAKMDERFAKFDERFAKFDERFAKSDERFAKFESQTDQTLKILMEIMRELRNGHSKA